jgi:hypothetical protein
MEYGKFFPENIIYLVKQKQDIEPFNGSLGLDEIQASIVTPVLSSLSDKEIQKIKKTSNAHHVFVKKNTFLNGLRIIDSHFNGSFNVLMSDGYMHHISLLTMSECFINVGVKTKGIIDSNFIWAYTNNYFQLVRVGSSKFNELILRQKLHLLPFIKQNEMQEGDVYMSKGKAIFVYLGRGDTKKFNFKTLHDYKTKEVKNAFIFAKFPKSFNVSNIQNIINDPAKLLKYINISKSNACVKKIDSIIIPKDIISNIHYAAQYNVRQFSKDDKQMIYSFERFGPALYLTKYGDNAKPYDMLRVMII